ncbi:MAG TPA: ABC transporter ATP-binding protein [Acholeplasmataceae bacterium]|nr:ABC transporter ATP-binding protein [Acholeplasmataceae bacterium]
MKLLPYFKKYKWYFIISAFFILIVSGLVAINPYVEGLITSSLHESLLNDDPVNLDYILTIVLFLIGSYTLIGVLRLTFNFLLTKAIQSSMKSLRDDVQQKIHRLPIKYFDTHPIGDIMSRMSNDVETVGNGLQQSFSTTISAFLTIIFILTMMFILKPSLALIGLAMFPVILIIARVILKKSRPLYNKRYSSYGVLTGHLQEQYTGFKEITLYNKQEDASKMFDGIMDDLSDYVFKSDFISGLLNPLVSTVTYIALVFISIFGAKLVISGVILLGVLQTFIKYIWRLGTPISQITQMSIVIQSTFAAASRVFEFLSEDEEIKDTENPLTINNLNGSVEFKNVSFSYNKERPILKNISFKANPGQMIAIVGPTGSGKTTIINLLMRFYDIDEGQILLDEIDIRSLKKDELRTIFGMVLQDTWLFNGTIAENIKYGKDDATMEEIIKAAENAKIDHYVKTLPKGYQMKINEEGDNISQGEKQLLTIARAFLADPSILILDEATSTVDTRLELMLQEAMQSIMQDRTSFVIAHRLSTIKNADLIIVLKDGEIIETGNHEQLLKEQGFYFNLYNSQFSED